MPVTLDEVRELALTLPRTTEAFVRGRVKFRVGRIVYAAFSRDETLRGFGFPKEERVWLVGTEPEKFLMPRDSDLRYSWVVVRLAAIDAEEMRGLVIDAWRWSCRRASPRRTASSSVAARRARVDDRPVRVHEGPVVARRVQAQLEDAVLLRGRLDVAGAVQR